MTDLEVFTSNSKIISENSESLPVMEHFHTIQGEGHFSGTPAYFIRLGGCDVGCKWCDVKESWDVNAHPKIKISDLQKHSKSSKAPITVVTGGEPLMHDCSELTKALKQNHQRTHIETAGVYPITGDWDWICFSPKKFKNPIREAAQAAHELKVVIYHESDFRWAEKHRSTVSSSCICYLQPEWSKREEMMPLIVEYVKNNPNWKISLQTHKYLQIP